MAQADLAAITKKVRLLTRRLSASSISDTDIKEYVNTFILYDLGYINKLQQNKTNLVFSTIPNIDLYTTESIALGTPNTTLDNFKNRILQIEKPVYIDGYQVWLSQDQTLFYQSYPRIPIRKLIATGDGVTTNYIGNLTPPPLISGETEFSAVSINGKRMAGVDEKSTSEPSINKNIVRVGTNTWGATGTINLLTGAYNVTFDAAPGNGEEVYASFVNYQPTRPQSVLFFDEQFILRPIPDKTYKVEMEVYVVPTELDLVTDIPEIAQWWQWISYGAAIKIFQDNSDHESAQEIYPEFDRQERLAMRTTIGQLSTNRVATIYTLNNRAGGPFNYWNWGGPL